jgi:hypothetical protein
MMRIVQSDSTLQYNYQTIENAEDDTHVKNKNANWMYQIEISKSISHLQKVSCKMLTKYNVDKFKSDHIMLMLGETIYHICYAHKYKYLW